MTLVLKFWTVFMLCLLFPHVDGNWRYVLFVGFTFALIDLIWRGLKKEDDID